MAVHEQALADRDQALADRDQSASDSDQTAADGDQTASDTDQAASDLDLAQGGDATSHEAARDIRARGTRQRNQAAEQRVEAAAARDAVARARDRAAAARDQAAAVRDQAAAVRDSELRTGEDADDEAQSERHHGDVADRDWAVEFRALAAADREQAALDRRQAALDRIAAEADREALLQRLVNAETDELTGARTRAAGLADLEREIARSRRGEVPLATAYIDVVGLKAVNDTRGHSAGDELLRRVVHAIRAQMRSYDLIVRMGGDEFLCVMSDATVEIARQRFGAVQADLAADDDERCEIRFGVAELAPQDTALDLVKRADAKQPPR